MKVRGWNYTCQLANVFETLTLPSPWPGRGEPYRVGHSNRPYIGTDNLALSVYKN